MQGRGVKPDNVTYSGLIAAFERGGQWREALRAFEGMRAANCRPDSAAYNTAVGVLWSTGLASVQARAMQLFQAACRQGHFRMAAHMNGDAACLEHGLHVFTVGAAVAALVRWLLELRDRASKETPMVRALLAVRVWARWLVQEVVCVPRERGARCIALCSATQGR